MTLYELTEQYKMLLELAEDPDTDPTTLTDTMEALTGEIEDKADGYAAVIQALQDDVECIAVEAKRLQNRKKSIEANIDRMKASLMEAMKATGKTKFKTALRSFSIAKNPASVVIDAAQLTDIPAVYLKQRDPDIDKAALKKALQEGVNLEGVAHLVQSEGLRIRSKRREYKMAIPVLVFGKSGSGKSRSMKNFGEDEILLVNVEGKSLPFRRKFKYTMISDKLDTIIEQLQKMPCKTAVIDDAGYMMTHQFMDKHRMKKGNASFEMYDDIADTMYNLVKRVKNEVEPDKIVYIILHEDMDDFGNAKLKTLGKLLDNKVCLEGMVTICIRCMSDKDKHFFRVRTDGSDITKTPEEMFEGDEIENDLKAVDDAIREYYGLEVKKNENE